MCVIKFLCVLSENDFKHEGDCFRVVVVIDDMSLVVINKGVITNGQETNNLRTGVLQMLFPERLYKEESAKDKCFDTINVKKLQFVMKLNLFKIKWLQPNGMRALSN